MSSTAHSLAPSLALLWASALHGRRVLVLGAVDHPLTEALLTREPRHVHVFDPDEARAEEFEEAHAQEHGRILRARTMPDESGVRVAAYDTVVVPNADRLPDWTQALAIARRSLGFDGVLLAAIRPDAQKVPYSRLYESVASEFEYVSAYASSPFSGFAHARMGEAETDELTVDPELGDAPEPALYVVVASSSEVDFGAYTLVQVPEPEATIEPLPAPAVMPEAASVAELEALRRELSELAAERQAEADAYEQKLAALALELREMASERDEALRIAKQAFTAPALTAPPSAEPSFDIHAFEDRLAAYEGEIFARDCRIQELEAARK